MRFFLRNHDKRQAQQTTSISEAEFDPASIECFGIYASVGAISEAGS